MRVARGVPWISLALVALACNKTPPRIEAATPLRAVSSTELRAVADFASITNNEERARALFTESARVLLHPRCVNCQPDGDAPLQGMDQRPHDPPVERGAAGGEHGDQGIPALACANCHQTKNLALARVPGAPKWALAPREMTWQNRTPQQICEQIKDPARNGGKTLAQLVEHMAHDELVGWAWNPGHDREPAPGTQAQLGALMQAWVELGAVCPSEMKEAK